MTRDKTTIDILMAKNGMRTDKELAEALGLKPQTLSFRLKGDISLKTIEQIAEYFDVHIKEMFRD